MMVPKTTATNWLEIIFNWTYSKRSHPVRVFWKRKNKSQGTCRYGWGLNDTTERAQRARWTYIIGAGSVALIARGATGVRGYIVWHGARDGRRVHATRLACGRSHDIKPWPDQKPHDGNQTGGRRDSHDMCLNNCVGRMVIRRNRRSPRRGATAIKKLHHASQQCHMYGPSPIPKCGMICAVVLCGGILLCVKSTRCPRGVTPVLESMCTVPPQ